MKKELRWKTLVIAVIAVVIVCGLVSLVEYLRERKRASRKSYTLDDLEILAEQLASTSKEEASGTTDKPIAANGTMADKAVTSAALPSRLEATVPPETLAKRRVTRRLRDRLFIRLRTITGYKGPHRPAFMGSDMMQLGEWDAARHYLWEAVEVYKTSDPTQCKIALGQLAWLEDDPEKAARLLQLSCQGKFQLPYPLNKSRRYQEGFPNYEERTAANQLLNAFNLCEQTESVALADHYLTRLRREYPVQAKEYENRGWIPLSENP
jgi:hypothetical protein